MRFSFGRQRNTEQTAMVETIGASLGARSLVLIGMMGCGKSSIGRRLAKRLDLKFVDADSEIERAAGQTISEIFAEHGEAYFRDGERRVIARLLDNGPQVLATGGGAYVNELTRNEIRARGISIWLDADIDVLFQRVRRRSNRPLLKTANPKETLQALLDERNPIYAQADIRIRSREVPHDVIIGEILAALARAPLLVSQGSAEALPETQARANGHDGAAPQGIAVSTGSGLSSGFGESEDTPPASARLEKPASQ